MKRNFELILILVLSLLSLLGCSNQSTAISEEMESSFQMTFPDVEMNKEFILQINSNEKTFKLGTEIPLTFANNSPNTIYFATDSFIKVLTISEEEWIEVKNKNTYSGMLLLSPKGTPLKDRNITGVRPDSDLIGLNGDEKSKLIRIVMIGEIMQNDIPTGKIVGAYVDTYVYK